MGHSVAQLVEALRYKPESRGFDSRWCHWNFSILPTSNRNEYHEYFLGRCVGLTTLPPSCADCLEICEPQPPATLKACPGVYRDCFTYIIHCKSSFEQSTYYEHKMFRRVLITCDASPQSAHISSKYAKELLFYTQLVNL